MWNYIIIGGGAAGCVLANRLSHNCEISVLLIESGPIDNHPYIHMPIGFAKLTVGSGPYTWGYQSTPQKNCYSRSIPLAQGRVIGGGSSINAMVFTRGAKHDYDRWAHSEGCNGWSFNEVQKYFLLSEDNDRLSLPYHGVGGFQSVSDPINPSELSKQFVKATQEFGLKYNSDFNGEEQYGTGLYQTFTRKGKRCSAASGYLKSALFRKNLTVLYDTTVSKIIFEKNRAIGVELIKDNNTIIENVENEIILSAGAIGTPKLLMLSGIGSDVELKKHDIKTIISLPGVGKNLQDHYDVDIVYELKNDSSLDKYKKVHWMLWAGLEYLFFNKGPVTSNAVEAGAFNYSKDEKLYPDIQFHFLPAAGIEEGVPLIKSGNGCTLNSYYLRPSSRGTVKLRSNSPLDHPLIDPNYIDDIKDLEISIQGLVQSREIMNQHSLKEFIKTEHFPGPSVKNNQDIENYVRNYGRTSYHHVGTCKMGKDEMSVVDTNLKVYGSQNLRVVDSSIMPSIVSSNTYAPILMIAEKGSDIILQDL
ncbi:MAG: GMC family oxidoreductase N-terminal domain-containing protein [SAR324 cluster bacterium]|nr:GMC family oxidoreductase N-terminal domain-containing protein [SAR324 cluster bacterium]